MIFKLWFPFCNLSRGWTSIATIGDLCTSSWSYFCLDMTYAANTFGIKIISHITFLFLIIKGLSSSSSSSESFAFLWSLVYNYLGDMMDDARGHLVFYNQSFNSNVFTLDVKASYAPANVASNGICSSIFGKKCCIKISMTNIKWQTSFLVSTFTIPLNIIVLEVVDLFNSFYNCLNMVFAQSIAFPFIVGCLHVMVDPNVVKIRCT